MYKDIVKTAKIWIWKQITASSWIFFLFETWIFFFFFFLVSKKKKIQEEAVFLIYKVVGSNFQRKGGMGLKKPNGFKMGSTL